MVDNPYRLKNQMHLPENGLEGALFELLDTETEKEIRQYIKVSLFLLKFKIYYFKQNVIIGMYSIFNACNLRRFVEFLADNV